MSKRPNLSPTFIATHQRRRVVLAIAALAHESGIEEVTVSGICRAARVGRSHLYDLFDGRDGCIGYALTEAFETVFGATEAMELGPSERWLADLDSALGTLFSTIAAQPLLAELCLVHAAGSTAAPGHDFEAAVDVLLRLIGGGREGARTNRDSARPAPESLVEEYLAGSIVSLARLRIMQGKAAALPGHREEMTLLVASAIYGPEAGMRAWRELGYRHR